MKESKEDHWRGGENGGLLAVEEAKMCLGEGKAGEGRDGYEEIWVIRQEKDLSGKSGVGGGGEG